MNERIQFGSEKMALEVPSYGNPQNRQPLVARMKKIPMKTYEQSQMAEVSGPEPQMTVAYVKPGHRDTWLSRHSITEGQHLDQSLQSG